MPVQIGKDSNSCFARWGKQKKYYYECGNEQARERAKDKALKQGIAIGEYKLQQSYTDYPQAATENAKIALRWAEENGWGSCGTPVGKARANQLANREPISRDTIARMAAFERHRQNSDKELGDGCGRLMWQAWGGDEGIEWAQRKLKQIDEQQSLTVLQRVKQIIFNRFNNK
jgi:beta-galactosidase GanA